jgi:hypothetical protein
MVESTHQRFTYCLPALIVLTLGLPPLVYFNVYTNKQPQGSVHYSVLSNHPSTHLAKGDEVITSGMTRVANVNLPEPNEKEVPLPKDYSSLFYLADVRPVIEQAIQGVMYFQDACAAIGRRT